MGCKVIEKTGHFIQRFHQRLIGRYFDEEEFSRLVEEKWNSGEREIDSKYHGYRGDRFTVSLRHPKWGARELVVIVEQIKSCSLCLITVFFDKPA